LVGVPLNYRYTIPEIDRALAVSGASILLAHAERAQELIGSSRVRELPRGLIFHEAEKERGPSLWDLIATAPAKKELRVLKASDPAFVFFTSGSTGPAKGVTHSYEAIGWMFATAAAAFELVPGDAVSVGTAETFRSPRGRGGPGTPAEHVAGRGCVVALRDIARWRAPSTSRSRQPAATPPGESRSAHRALGARCPAHSRCPTMPTIFFRVVPSVFLRD
jgi:acyl-CoA synthetase (AMP-forming)/AMP-acid ligase II